MKNLADLADMCPTMHFLLTFYEASLLTQCGVKFFEHKSQISKRKDTKIS